ncbi:acetyltransferase [Rhizobium sp. Root274]|uniref:GNAT family N-acetyltransferase n=1 Tax=unclassified Rhizobium TaxID=2613769 RepID=UPI000712549C|nr:MULTISPECIES: GNAT family N-acetyltransferase [unclassified Rhizobium]KQW30830.1 acetyltransferase [Rhizobium sp. Root1240]KRD32375.1 acetyltransferase [Rhizobium sp. Root274]
MQVQTLQIREATENDLEAIIALFADDPLGGHGDTTDLDAQPKYRAAFARIAASPNETLYVAELDGEVVGTFQTMITTTMTALGSSSMIIEAVQTRADIRGRGIGAAMIGYAVERARTESMRLVQLTSNAARKDAHRFYERLGFAPSHLGFKLKLK